MGNNQSMLVAKNQILEIVSYCIDNNIVICVTPQFNHISFIHPETKESYYSYYAESFENKPDNNHFINFKNFFNKIKSLKNEKLS